MTPYYEHAGITIYHGDAREYLPLVTGDVIVTDPPYGVGESYLSFQDTALCLTNKRKLRVTFFGIPDLCPQRSVPKLENTLLYLFLFGFV